jgi:hypothetical protein
VALFERRIHKAALEGQIGGLQFSWGEQLTVEWLLLLFWSTAQFMCVNCVDVHLAGELTVHYNW